MALVAAAVAPLGWRQARTVLSLPCYPYLTDAEQDAVIAAVKEAT